MQPDAAAALRPYDYLDATLQEWVLRASGHDAAIDEALQRGIARRIQNAGTAQAAPPSETPRAPHPITRSKRPTGSATQAQNQRSAWGARMTNLRARAAHTVHAPHGSPCTQRCARLAALRRTHHLATTSLLRGERPDLQDSMSMSAKCFL